MTLNLLWAFLIGSASGVTASLLTSQAIRRSERSRMLGEVLEKDS